MNGQTKKTDANVGLMTVSDVARYLSLSEKTVYRMAQELPAMRVGGRWRFRVSDLDAWLLRRRSENEPLPEPVSGPGLEMRLWPYLRPDNIFLDVPEVDAKPLLERVVQSAQLDLTESPPEAARQGILDSILERESLCSTALDPAVAFPHPREPERCPLASDRILVVRAASPVEFREVHGYRPRLVFVLLARSVALQLLWEARLSHLFHREGIAGRLLEAGSPEEVCRIFGGAAQTFRTAESGSSL